MTKVQTLRSSDQGHCERFYTKYISSFLIDRNVSPVFSIDNWRTL